MIGEERLQLIAENVGSVGRRGKLPSLHVLAKIHCYE